MDMWRTKEASSLLGVSQTTIRRWIGLLPAAPMRDSLGGYLFSATDMDQLRSIKEQLESGKMMNDITLQPANGELPEHPLEQPCAEEHLPSGTILPLRPMEQQDAALMELAVSGAHAKTALLAADTEQLLARLESVEHAVSRKADEVVTFQLLQHRKELEEIRQTVSKLAASLEQLQLPLQMAAAAKETIPAAKPKRRRRNIFRLLF